MSPRQEPDALSFEREITVTPAQAQAYTKHNNPPYLQASYGESVAGAKRKTQSRLWPPPEDLEDS